MNKTSALSLITLVFALVFYSQAYAREQPRQDLLRVGFVYNSPVGEVGWAYAQDMGRRAVAALPGAQTVHLDSVPEGPDSERVIRAMAEEGLGLIFTTSYGYMEPTLKVAKDFPRTVFMHCSGFKTAPNVGNYFGRMYQARYLTGIVAGGMSKSKILGYVAAFPIPEVIRGINAFTLGALSVNPEITVRVAWTQSWYNPELEKKAAESLLDRGADVIAQHQDSPEPQRAAEARGAFSVGYNSDMSRFAPKAHLTAAVWNWGPLYRQLAEEVAADRWRSSSLWLGLESGVVDIAPFGPMVPPDLQELAQQAKGDLVGGRLVVFTGPVKDQRGEMRIAPGETASDHDLRGMTWFVQGVLDDDR
ncbi:MAG: BMP family ABC transporter substrate-binding protein [Desulfobulbaceae bacterium]|jgi:basic membrane protein A|nr:BMP family ABC transporter substrate-binding protein [Desulfobulbaceae bacterium]